MTTACGGTYTSEHGTIATPGYPHNHPRNVECVWTLVTSPGNSVTLSFKEFELTESANCNVDYLEARAGGPNGDLIDVFCGTNATTITSQKPLWLKFASATELPKKGFAAEYHLVHGNDLTGPSGDIASPLYPQMCMLYGEYTWRITVDYRSSIRIDFKRFHIETYSDSCYTSVAVSHSRIIFKQTFELLNDKKLFFRYTMDTTKRRPGSWINAGCRCQSLCNPPATWFT